VKFTCLNIENKLHPAVLSMLSPFGRTLYVHSLLCPMELLVEMLMTHTIEILVDMLMKCWCWFGIIPFYKEKISLPYSWKSLGKCSCAVQVSADMPMSRWLGRCIGQCLVWCESSCIMYIIMLEYALMCIIMLVRPVSGCRVWLLEYANLTLNKLTN